MEIEIRAARLDERPAICHLINLAYDAESHGPSLANPIESVGEAHMDPHDRPENTRVLLVDGTLVSTLHIWEREAYARGDTVPFGIITTVATHPKHRRKGYVRLLMADAEEYMRGRGWAYGLLIGAVRTYGGSIGWRLTSQDQKTLGWKYVLEVRSGTDRAVRARPATDEDVPFLARLYTDGYSRLFGPVIRSHEFWRRWSLQRTWDGTYEIAMRNGTGIGYFHVGAGRDSMDEIAWEPSDMSAGPATFRAAASLAADSGARSISFWLNDGEEEGFSALKAAFGRVARVYCAPNGQPAPSSDPTPYRQANWPEGMGYMAKHLNPGPGILAQVNSTEDLTRVMAQRSWTYLDGDGM